MKGFCADGHVAGMQNMRSDFLRNRWENEIMVNHNHSLFGSRAMPRNPLLAEPTNRVTPR